MENEKLTLEGKIVIFKTIAISQKYSKILFQSFITTVLKHIINQLQKIQKAFLQKNSTPKMKLSNDYKAG